MQIALPLQISLPKSERQNSHRGGTFALDEAVTPFAVALSFAPPKDFDLSVRRQVDGEVLLGKRYFAKAL